MDAAIVTTLDEGGDQEDVQLIIADDAVYLRQWDDTSDKFAVILMSYQQLLDLAASLNRTEGLFKIEIQKRGDADGASTN